VQRDPGDGAEHGLLLIPTAYEQLVMERDPHHAAETAARATAIGRRFGDAAKSKPAKLVK
jgi:hypothetical protein